MPSLILATILLLLSDSASAVTLTSRTAGFAAMPTQNSPDAAYNVDIEIMYNVAACYRRGVVEFDIAGTGLTSVDSAVVTIFNGKVGSSEAWYWPVDVYGYVGDSEVTGIDFDAGDFVTTATWYRYGPNDAEFTIDLTSFVNAQRALGSPVSGLSLRAQGEYYCQLCSAAFIYFDGAGRDHPPALTLATVPDPSEAWPLGASLGSLGGLRWRRRESAV